MEIFSKKKKEELVLLFDIGSSSVGGALFYMGHSGTPRIIFSTRELLVLEGKISHDKFLLLTLDALASVASRICMSGRGAPKKIFCALSSPWHYSQTRIIHTLKDEQFVFTSQLAESLIEKEVVNFEKENKEKYSHETNKLKIIELKNMGVKLNGYHTLNPYNQKATELELISFISVSEEEILQKVKQTINRHFQSESVRFFSFLMASFTVARDTFVNQENFLLVNIGGEVTDISMIKKDILNDSISFPMGCNFMIRGVSTMLGCKLDEARSYISLYKDGHMEQSIEKKFETIIEKLKIEWLRGFQNFLSQLTNDVSIPATIFITVDQDLANFFSEIIKSEQFNQYILTESKFRVVFLGNQPLHGVAQVSNDTHHDSFLIIESIYINRFLV